MAKKKSKKMNINPKYLSGSKNPGRRAQLIRQIAEIYKKGKPYPSNLNALMKERDKLQAGGNPYAMPTSAATSGYTSTMSGMAGAQQAAMQLAQVQQEVMDTQRRRDDAAKQREVQEQQQFQQGMQQGVQELADDLGKDAIQKAVNAARMAKIAKGTASAKQVAKASKDTGQLLTNLGNYGKGASDAAGAASAAGSSIGAGPIAAAASLLGKGVERVSDDDDDTRTNFGEGAGRLMSGAGTGVGLAAMVGLGPIGLIGAGLVGGTAALMRQRRQKLEAREEEARQQAQDRIIANAEQAAFNRSMFSTGQDMGFNVGSSMSNSYLPGYQMQGGGLWANIRAKRARGEKMRKKGEKGAPTEAQMQRAKAQAGGSREQQVQRMLKKNNIQGDVQLLNPAEVEGTYDEVNARRAANKKRFVAEAKDAALMTGALGAMSAGTPLIVTGLIPEAAVMGEVLSGMGANYGALQLLNQTRSLQEPLDSVRARVAKEEKQAGGTITPDDPKIQAATATSRYLDQVDPNRLGMSLQYDNTLEGALLGAGKFGTVGLRHARGIANTLMTGQKMPNRFSTSNNPIDPKVMEKVVRDQTSRLKFQEGGYMRPLPGGAVEFVGPKHSQGGIMLDPQTEVEGGETMDKVKMKENGGKPADYIFSDYLKLGGKTFAARHKEMLAGGAKQKQIQELAKLQEQVAKREGRDENGPRGPERIMKAGGVKKHQSGDEITGVIPSPDALDQYELDPEGAYARDFPEGQSRTEEGLYRRADGDEVTMAQVENLKANNPWYDWEDFDPTDPEDVEAFQKAYNEKVPEGSRIKVDGKVGEQTISAYIPYRRSESEEKPPEETPTDTPTEETEDIPEDTPVMDLPRERRDILLPYQLIGPMAELSTKYPQPNKIAAPVTGRIKLPRVNFNAERAALASSTNAANKFIQNNAAGPGAIAAQMATIDKQRQGNIDIATQEARQNKQLAAQEELSNLQASQFDASQVARARQFNAASQNQRDQNEYEKRMLAFNQLGTNLAQFSNDMRAYRSEDRAARAYQIDNEYDRQVSFENAKRQARRKNSPYYGMTDMQIREEIARAYEQGAPTWNMQNQRRANAVIQSTGTTPETNEETTTQKRGGYVRKLGGVRRRRR
jgi:hypothetical protein